MKSKKIFVVGNATHYTNWINNHEVVDNPEKADILFFTGGEDVTPLLYGEEIGSYTHCNLDRDHRELLIFNKYPDKFKIGVCRGFQFLTVASGGKMIQHVTGHTQTHYITDIFTNKRYLMTSTHHQMAYPFDIEHELIAVSSENRSKVYLGGNDLNIKLPKYFAEPEIAYYPKTKSLGIQGHPEMFANNNPEVKDYLNGLINKYLK